MSKPDTPVGKIAVAASGAVSYDGVPVTLEVLGERLADLKRRNGHVFYYREAGDREPTSSTPEKVLDLVIGNKLPISLFRKPDYSEYLGSDGKPHPREPRPN